jgi:hypothetical protein
MSELRVPLFQRLPEIYRTKDAGLSPPDQLRDYLALVEGAFGAIHENIESLYHDLFIEFCDEWAIPYIGDLLGTTHLSGDPHTLRADVADTIALRRRKGTLGAIELLTFNLTGWGVHCVELLENMVWNQHLNHQRPDDGGPPPYRDPNPAIKRQTPIRGGTINLRDPALLALLGTPFDPFAHTADVKPPANGSIRYNLPNLAIFLWRLAAYRIRVIRPIVKGPIVNTGFVAPLAAQVVRFSINPVDRPYIAAEKDKEPVRLFNTNLVSITNTARTGTDSLDNSRLAPSISLIDETPGPIPVERLTQDSSAGAPEAYVSVETYDATVTDLNTLDLSDVGLQLHLPDAVFAGESFPPEPGQLISWKIRGANLCDWENGLQLPLEEQEIAIDPVIGRMVIGVGTPARATALVDDLLLTYTYGAVGPVGAHPTSRPPLPKDKWDVPAASIRQVNANVDPLGLLKALKDIHITGDPIVIEINDSLTHTLDLSDPFLNNEKATEGGLLTLLLNRSVAIRAANNQRPIIELAQPLRFRPVNVAGATPAQQNEFNAVMSELTVRLEGLYLTRGESFPPNPNHDDPLVTRAAINSLEIVNCTLDPGGYQAIDPAVRAPILDSVRLDDSYGFVDADEQSAFNQIPNVVLRRTISGPLLIDSLYRLDVTESIIDAGQGVGNTTSSFAVTSATDPANGWGPPAVVTAVTILGRMRVESIEGRGGIWVHALEVLDNQKGCIKFSYFSGESRDRLPQNHACVKGTDAALRFTSEFFGNPAYCQLAHSADHRIREQGPESDEMGAFGFLTEAHKWRNLQIRFREFMPVGIRPLLIPAT